MVEQLSVVMLTTFLMSIPNLDNSCRHEASWSFAVEDSAFFDIANEQLLYSKDLFIQCIVYPKNSIFAALDHPSVVKLTFSCLINFASPQMEEQK